jgi:hypothetical protein
MFRCHPERSEGSLGPFGVAFAWRSRRWWSEPRDASLALSMTDEHGVEYGGRTSDQQPATSD